MIIHFLYWMLILAGLAAWLLVLAFVVLVALLIGFAL
jgi:hypothetical protein